jgi:SAM-dependent methyltransferase
MTDGAAPRDHWFEDLADHLGEAYLRYSFTKGTEQEVAFLVDVLDLRPGHQVLDVGCGPGRHAHALARRGIDVLGIDISERFVELATAAAPDRAEFRRVDARRLDDDLLTDGRRFDAVISLCQGAFGLLGATAPTGGSPPDPDAEVLAAMARALVPGGRVAVSAFSAYFQLRYLEPERDTFDASTGVNHERTEIRDPDGRSRDVDLWTSCFTPRELRLMAERAGLAVEALWSVTPGAYAASLPDLEHPELLLVARHRGS